MLVYKKENGFPMTLMIETGDHHEVLEDGDEWKGYESLVSDEEQNLIARFKHNNLRDRVTWVKGFFRGLQYLEPWRVPTYLDEEYNWKEPYLPLVEEDGTSNLSVGDWVVTKDSKVRRIDMDDQEDLPFEIIDRFASRSEAKNAKDGSRLRGETEVPS